MVKRGKAFPLSLNPVHPCMLTGTTILTSILVSDHRCYCGSHDHDLKSIEYATLPTPTAIPGKSSSAADMSAMGRSSSPQFEARRDRLPTLYEVLARKTKPPVDLFSFYIYMRDQQRSVDYLDFW